MHERWLVRLEIPSIQRYIFGSEVLREVVGASFLVRLATEEWPREIAKTDAGGEVFSAGGGRTLSLFDTTDAAKAFVGELSWRLLNRAPGMPFLIRAVPFDWDAPGSLRVAIETAGRHIQAAKLAGTLDGRLGPLPVTVRCQSTGDAAAAYVAEPGADVQRAVSRAVEAKRDADLLDRANLRLEESFGRFGDRRYPLDFDDLGRSRGESSYIAVVHADGNAMGEAIARLLRGVEGAPNAEYLQTQREIGQTIEQAGTASLSALMTWVRTSVLEDAALMKDLSPRALPIRPLVYGGDDATFVCDGRIGLQAANEYLRAFEHQLLAAGDQRVPPRACAGVAIVKSHYPFSRAYLLADELIESAKTFARATAVDAATGPYPSALDWHFAQTGIHRSVEDTRARWMVPPAAGDDSERMLDLVMRPLLLTDPAGKVTEPWRTWRTFTVLSKTFSGEAWDRRRAKRHELFEALQRGPKAAAEFVSRSRIDLPPVARAGGDHLKTGYGDSRCVYFDALEAVGMSAIVSEERR